MSTIVFSAAAAQTREISPDEIAAEFQKLRDSGMRRNDAVKLVSEKFGVRKNEVYKLLLERE